MQMAELLTTQSLLAALEGHRRLTLRTAEAFPEDALFSHRVEGMRPFAEMLREIGHIELGYVRGIATGEWSYDEPLAQATTKADLLAGLREIRAQTLAWWPRITAERLLQVERDPFFGGEEAHLGRVMYMLENEIHHRGQGYVYLRQLGVEPPPFWER